MVGAISDLTAVNKVDGLPAFGDLERRVEELDRIDDVGPISGLLEPMLKGHRRDMNGSVGWKGRGRYQSYDLTALAGEHQVGFIDAGRRISAISSTLHIAGAFGCGFGLRIPHPQ